MDAELVLDRGAESVVAPAERPVRVNEEFRHQEERDAARAGRRVGQAREDEVHDVVRIVVLAIGDEDLAAEDAVGAVIGAGRAGAQCGKVGARLRLGQVHRAGPFAGDELFEIGRLEVVRSVFRNGFRRAGGQRRAEREGDGSRVPHLHRGHGEHGRQALAAEFLGTGKPVPAALDPVAVGLAPAGRRRYRGILPDRADLVADLVKRRQFFGGEAAGFAEDRVDQIVGKITETAISHRPVEPRDMFQGECDVVDWRAIHRLSSGSNAWEPWLDFFDVYVKLEAKRRP